jgi:hypothetical protein
MKSFWFWVLAVMGTFALLLAIGLGLGLFVGLPEVISSIEIDGRRLDFNQLRTEYWLLMGIGVVVAAVVITIMVVLGLAVGLVASLLGLAAGAAALALVMAPFALLVWWLWKEPKKPSTMA